MQKKVDGLTPMWDWLVGRGLKATTATTCVSTTRKLLERMCCGVGVVPTDAQMALVFDDLDVKKAGSAYSIRYAWRTYASWVAEVHGVAIPVSYAPSSKAAQGAPMAKSAVPLPQAVRDAVRTLVSSGLGTIAKVHALTWEHVDWGSMRNETNGDRTILIRDPLKVGSSVRVPVSAVLELAEYAQAGDVYSTPMVPLCPRSSLPYPLGALQREAATQKVSVLDRARALTEQAKGAPGSALGGAGVYVPGVPVLEALKNPSTLNDTLTALGAVQHGVPQRVEAPKAAPAVAEFEDVEQVLEVLGQFYGMTPEEVRRKVES